LRPVRLLPRIGRLLYIDEGKLREYVIYVDRTEVKVEEKA
jgi:hypothetical protein